MDERELQFIEREQKRAARRALRNRMIAIEAALDEPATSDAQRAHRRELLAEWHACQRSLQEI